MLMSGSKTMGLALGGVIRSLDRAPQGYYIQTARGFMGPYQSEDAARRHLPARALGADGRLPDLTDAVVWWAGKPR